MLQHRENKKENSCTVKVRKMSKTLPNMSKGENPTDQLGSYTGTPSDGITPTQDADDL